MLGCRLRRLHSIGALVLAFILGPLVGGHQAFGAEQATPSLPTAYDDFLAPPQPAPTDLRARSIVGNLVTLQWVGFLNGPFAYYGVEGGLHPGEVLVSMTTSSPIITFTAPPGIFYVRVWAQFGSDRSQPSNEIRIFVNVPAPPSPPAHLLGLVNGTDVSLAWRNTYAGGEPTAFFLDVSGSLNGTVPLPPGESIGFGAVPAGTYTLTLRAVNAAGVSAPSNAITLDVPGPCSGVPLPPADRVLVVSGRQVSLFWDTPIGGPAPAGFVVSAKGPLMGSFLTTAKMVSAAVEPGIYTVTLATFNTCGTGAANPWTFEVR